MTPDGAHTPRMRIVYVTLQGLQEGQGAATHVRAMVTGLRRSHDVVLCAPRETKDPSAFTRVLRMARVQASAMRQARQGDVVYMRHHPFLFVLSWLLRLIGTPSVQELNGPIEDYVAIYPVLRPLMSVLRYMTVRSLLAADAVVVVSERLKRYLIDLGVPGDRIHVVHNGADLDQFQPSNGLSDSYALFYGALTPWQGLETLALATIDPGWPAGVRLVVVGGGPSEKALDVGSPAVIERRGVVPHSEVAELVAGSLVTLSPKTPEATWSSPLKFYESVACGVPVIATDVGEQADFIREWGCGLVIAEENPKTLAEAVAKVSADDGLRARMATAGIRVREQVSWDLRVNRVAGLLREVIDRTADGHGGTYASR